MAFVDRNSRKDLYDIDVGPGNLTPQLFHHPGIKRMVQLYGEKTTPLMRHQSRSADAGNLLSGTLDRERKQYATFVFNTGIASPKQPHSPAAVEVPCISRAVPAHMLHIEFCFGVALRVLIP